MINGGAQTQTHPVYIVPKIIDSWLILIRQRQTGKEPS